MSSAGIECLSIVIPVGLIRALDLFGIMKRRSYSLQQILYERMPLALAISLSVFISTLLFTSIHIFHLLFAGFIGLLFSLISIEGLTGGTKLSWLEIPIVIGGEFLSRVIFYSGEYVVRWVLFIQFLAVVIAIDCALTIILRSRIEEFCRHRRAGQRARGEI